ncbi:MAG: ribosome biogenesis GTPase YlqF [Clostridiales bacterium]|nr:ribosome biogenesis GTPase YlqF [Clostridiales bacterium]
MNIQWFPGHMTKALRMMEENVKIVDAIGYVLDARAPASCFNPSFQKIVGNKPCVFILNKCDLADNAKVELWCKYFRENNLPFVKVTATASAEASKISTAFADITAELRAKYKAKGIFKPIRCLIIGVPNCGKSTIINCLSGRKAVITGDKPGVTKGKQWVRLQSGLELLDTPGTLWPKFDCDLVASRLCFIGSIKDDVVDLVEVAFALIEQLVELYPNCIEQRFKVQLDGKSTLEVFEEIAAKRGFLLRGGEMDSDRCAKAILDDFRKGKIGKITFDVPADLK